jgi:hypothetical protein
MPGSQMEAAMLFRIVIVISLIFAALLTWAAVLEAANNLFVHGWF